MIFALILPSHLVNVANLLPLLDPPPGDGDLPQRTAGLPRQGDRGGVGVAGVVEEGGHAGVEGGAEDGPGHSARGQVADLCRKVCGEFGCGEMYLVRRKDRKRSLKCGKFDCWIAF